MVWSKCRSWIGFRSGVVAVALFLMVTFVGLRKAAAATTHYIAANGSDANNGTSKSSPWLHAPGMATCSGACASYTPAAGDQFIFRGGDTWHAGNSGASPYTGGLWSFPWGDYAKCNYGGTMSGCIYFGVDQTWFTGASWARPILTGDNPPSASPVASCPYTVSGGDRLAYLGPGTIFDNFEVTGLCVSSTGMALDINNTGNGGTGTVHIYNTYIHGWTVTSSYFSGTVLGCVLIGGGFNGLMAIDHLVVDGSDSKSNACAWATFPSFYHFKDSIIRYTTQGVGQWCHDIHDNIFEYFDNPLRDSSTAVTHGNIFECNTDSDGTAAYQAQGTPNVFYNNIVRHATTNFSLAGQVKLWFGPPSTVPEYWFNNLEYDVGTNAWNIDWSQGGTGNSQYMFNNTLVDATQPCKSSLVVYNAHLINTPWDTASGCPTISDPSNISMTDATATSQGYTSLTGRINIQNSSTNCANEGTKPCTPTANTNSTVSAGTNHEAYCTALASYTSESAISVDAANACKYGTTDGCAYNGSTHTMNCPAQTIVARPTSVAWDIGAYQFSGSSGTGPAAPTGLAAVVQ